MDTILKPINWKAFLALFEKQLEVGVSYGYGAKAPRLNAAPGSFRQVDCSGEVRYLAYNSSGGLVIPDGSWIQREWCEKHLTEVPYGPADDELYLAFMTSGVNGVGSVGHVWFVKDGRTYESHGRTTGVDSRDWDYPTLKDHVHKTFKWPLVRIGTFALHQSNGDLMAKLLLFDRHAYVSARGQWQVWFPNTKVDWDAKTAVISINGCTTSTNRIINGEGYVLFTEAAAITGLTYLVNNNAREINLFSPAGAK